MTKTEKKSKMAAEEPLYEIETEACGRCGGTGRHSFCTAYLDTCFGCNGKGKRLTKRGAVANEFLRQIRSKAVEDLKAGDQIWIDAGPFSRGGWDKIVSISPCMGHFFSVDGVMTEEKDLVTITFQKSSHGGLSKKAMRRVRQAPEQAEVTWIRALAFQDTITKSGKPRK